MTRRPCLRISAMLLGACLAGGGLRADSSEEVHAVIERMLRRPEDTFHIAARYHKQADSFSQPSIRSRSAKCCLGDTIFVSNAQSPVSRDIMPLHSIAYRCISMQTIAAQCSDM